MTTMTRRRGSFQFLEGSLPKMRPENSYNEIAIQRGKETIFNSEYIMKFLITAAVAATTLLTSAAPAAEGTAVSYKSTIIRGLNIFYREAGPRNAPTLLLLHGFPSSSHMFRDLIPQLATKYHVIAPDYPGFGYSSAPSTEAFNYTFANLADVVDDFTASVGLNTYVLYMQDYGGPIGFRLALKHPEKVRGLIVQNAVVNVDGWNPNVVASFAPAWKNRTAETEVPLREAFSSDATKFQYIHGASHPDRVSPDAWTFDQARLDRPGNDKIQIELLYQYQDNVAQYPEWQEYLRTRKPPTLVVWGDNDPFFTTKGRDYFKKLVPGTQTHSFDAGHFALETHSAQIASLIDVFLARLPKGK